MNGIGSADGMNVRPAAGGSELAVLGQQHSGVKPHFLFGSPAMRRALENLPEIARADHTVLISGETGTGKELVARAVHVLSDRAMGPFVPVNCGAIPESLIEGELLGHEKGAFTGALRSRKGKFESAHDGTLFLDEIGDLPLNLQSRLLRLLEEKRVCRLGAERPVPIDVRVVAATNTDLRSAVRKGLFREDLYYRLNLLRIHLPPLRERCGDVALLAAHFLDRAFSEMERVPPYPAVSEEALRLIENLPWRGNVRELKNVMTRVATLLKPDTKEILPVHVEPHIEDEGCVFRGAVTGRAEEGIYIPVGTSLEKAEEMLIGRTLHQAGGNRTISARMLGISTRTLRRKLRKGSYR